MRQTVTGLVEKPVDAQRIIDELTNRCLSDRSDISLIAQNGSGQLSHMATGAARAAGHVAKAAGEAAATTFSGLAGVASAFTRQVPGVGVLSAFGQLGAALSRTALHTAEDLGKAFIDFGISQDLARTYSDALKQGHILIIIDAKTENQAKCAQQVLSTQGAVMPEVRATH
jgi:hypothetical protein